MSADAQLHFSFDHRPAMGQEDFLVAPCNEQAVKWIDSWPDWPGPALCLHGPTGCGKTHLAHVWQARSDAVMLETCEIAGRTPDDILDGATCCILENADGDADHPALLHLYNVVSERRGHLLLTAERPPARWSVTLNDLRSRLTAASAVQIGKPDESLVGAVMIKLFADRQIVIGKDVLVYLVMRIERSFEVARQVVDAVDSAALASQRRLTVPLARDVLRRLGMA